MGDRINRVARSSASSGSKAVKKLSKKSKKKANKKRVYSLDDLKSLSWDDLREVGYKFGVEFRSYVEAYREIMKAQNAYNSNR